MPPNPQPQRSYIERVELEVWWMSGVARRRFQLEGFRRNVLRPADMAAIGAAGSQ
jgi:hypothetical protein